MSQLTPLKTLDVPLFAPRKCSICGSPTDFLFEKVPLCTQCVVDQCRIVRRAAVAR